MQTKKQLEESLDELFSRKTDIDNSINMIRKQLYTIELATIDDNIGKCYTHISDSEYREVIICKITERNNEYYIADTYVLCQSSSYFQIDKYVTMRNLKEISEERYNYYAGALNSIHNEEDILRDKSDSILDEVIEEYKRIGE